MTKQTKNFRQQKLQKHRGNYEIHGILLAGNSRGSTLKWTSLWESIWRISFLVSKTWWHLNIFSFKIQLAEMSKRKQLQSLLNTFFRGKQERESNTTPTTPAAAPIKKTREFQELWKERLNFGIPGHLICVFKCCYRSPTVVIINIISVYKKPRIYLVLSSTAGLRTTLPFKFRA